MGEITGIAWATSTWSPWIGCTEVSPGCDHCYARELDARHKWGGATHWGAGVPRHRTKDWAKPLLWNRKAAVIGERWTVFPSLCDPFDNEVPEGWREDLWNLIAETPNLTWLLLTKRISNASKMIAYPDWDGIERPFWPNVWLGASIVNQEEADRDIPKLLAVPAAKRFVSYEPALGPVDFSPWLWRPGVDVTRALGPTDWLIVGGESDQGKHKARPFNVEWARSTVRQCGAAGVPVFVKQLGSNVVTRNDIEWDDWPTCDPMAIEHDIRGYREEYQGAPCRIRFLHDRHGADPAEWPEDLRVQEFPK